MAMFGLCTCTMKSHLQKGSTLQPSSRLGFICATTGTVSKLSAQAAALLLYPSRWHI